MLHFLALAVCLVSTVHAGIDYNNCKDEFGGYGATVECPAGFLPTSICSSGRRADCSGFYTILRCCAETTRVAKEETAEVAKACTTQQGSDGVYLTCPDNNMVFGICTSGQYADCGSGAFTRINCCNDHSQSLTNSCNWVHGNYGVRVDCGQNQVAAGACSSGYRDDCKLSGGAYTGVRCCVLSS